MALRDWLTSGPPLFRSARLTPPAQKLGPFQDYGAVPLSSTMLIHGPGATEMLAGVTAHGDGNSAVFACLAALSTAYIEAPLRVWRTTAKGRERVTTGAPGQLQKLLDAPNPAMTGPEVWHWVQWAKHCDGNAYLRKVRAGNGTTGNVTELWPLSPCRIEIRAEGGAFISAYRWHYAPGHWQDIDPANIIHFRLGLDDADPRRGLAPLKRLARALTTDEAAEAWAASLLQNGAIPGAVLQAPGPLTEEQAEQLKAKWNARFGGERRGSVGVLDNGATAAQFGFSPEQMVYEALSRQPETRIAGVLRVPAIVAGLGVGLDQATYSNARTLTEFFTERTMIPLWTMDAAKLQSQLVPDFAASDPRIVVAHDLTDVRALQEDEDSKYGRLDKAVSGGWITVDEARQDVGLDPLPYGGNVRRIPSTVTEVPADQAPPPPPVPQVPPGGAQAPAATDGSPAPTPIAAARQAAALDGLEGKAADAATVTDADVRAWRQRAASLGSAAPLLVDLLAAVPLTNGHGRH